MSTDSRSSLRHLFELVRREQVTTFIRVVSLILAVSLGFLGYGPLFTADSEAYRNPVFAGVFAFASPEAWGIAFLCGSALLLLTSMTGRAVIYIIAIAVSSATLAGWSSMIILESVLDEDAVITAGAVGLYIGSFVALIGLPFSPRQLAVAPPILAVAESGETTKLRRIG